MYIELQLQPSLADQKKNYLTLCQNCINIKKIDECKLWLYSTFFLKFYNEKPYTSEKQKQAI